MVTHDQCRMYLAHGCDDYFFSGDPGLSDVDLLPSHLSHYARNQLLFSPEVLTNKKELFIFFKCEENDILVRVWWINQSIQYKVGKRFSSRQEAN